MKIIKLFIVITCASLLKADFTQDIIQGSQAIEHSGVKHTTALKAQTPIIIEMAQLGSADGVQSELKNGVNPNVVDSQGQTALIVAAAAGHEPVVKLLLKNGANVNAYDQTGLTALMAAVQGNHADIVTEILANFPLMPLVNMTSFYKYQYKDKYGVRYLYNNRPHISNLGDITGQKALSSVPVQAVSGGHTALNLAFAQKNLNTQIITDLLVHGANPNLVGEGDKYPLTMAASRNNTDLVNLLLKHKAQVNAQDGFWQTALMAAAQENLKDMVTLLLNAGASPLLRDKMGLTALDKAKEFHANDVIPTLSQAMGLKK